MHSSLIGPLFSQVGISVTVQEVLSGVIKRVCVAFSTFVSKPAGTHKVRTRLCQEHLITPTQIYFYSTD